MVWIQCTSIKLPSNYAISKKSSHRLFSAYIDAAQRFDRHAYLCSNSKCSFLRSRSHNHIACSFTREKLNLCAFLQIMSSARICFPCDQSYFWEFFIDIFLLIIITIQIGHVSSRRSCSRSRSRSVRETTRYVWSNSAFEREFAMNLNFSPSHLTKTFFFYLASNCNFASTLVLIFDITHLLSRRRQCGIRDSVFSVNQLRLHVRISNLFSSSRIDIVLNTIELWDTILSWYRTAIILWIAVQILAVYSRSKGVWIHASIFCRYRFLASNMRLNRAGVFESR